ncbi:MAG TPA: FIST N-terminal domain-containing protein, partial [Geobacteraceae bacterium]|nr:FIST N-terminal domain-containing protein [Geobacteraceae bacterium]
MGTQVGVGYSFSRNPTEAGKAASLKAMEQAAIDRPDFVFVFATVGYNQQVLIDSINAMTYGAPLSGCSGEGIITQDVISETNFGVAVMVVKSDELRFHNTYATGIEDRLDIAGERLAGEIKPFLAADPVACLIFADGLIFNFDIFMTTFEKALPTARKTPVLGGMAADNWATRKTYQYHDNNVFSGGISCVAISGSGDIVCGVHHGCVPVGGRHKITRCKGNVIYEIDGIPALQAMQDFFEEDWQEYWNKTSINLCLGFKTPERIRCHYEEFMIRYMIAKNDLEGSVTIQSDVK